MRLFVALNLPEPEKQRLAELAAMLAGLSGDVRWLPPDSLHLTVKFLGDVGDSQLPAVGHALRHAVQGIPPLALELGGFGVFPGRARAQVFWIGAAPSEPLQRLHQRVETELAPLGFAPDARAFTPHLTIGRLQRSVARMAPDVVDRMTEAAVYSSTVPIVSAELMRSHLGPRGARYELLERAILING